MKEYTRLLSERIVTVMGKYKYYGETERIVMI